MIILIRNNDAVSNAQRINDFNRKKRLEALLTDVGHIKDEKIESLIVKFELKNSLLVQKLDIGNKEMGTNAYTQKYDSGHRR